MNQFLLKADDLIATKQTKLRILITLVSPDNVQALLREFTVRIDFSFYHRNLSIHRNTCRITSRIPMTRLLQTQYTPSVTAHDMFLKQWRAASQLS